MRALKDRAGRAEKLALVLCGAVAMALLIGLHVEARKGASTHAQAAKIEVVTPKSRLQCEQEYGKGTDWHHCFSQQPGSSCEHPLEIQKAGPTYRGDTKDFKVRFEQERDGEGGLLSYSYAPKKGIAICPHGAVFKVSLLAGHEICEGVHGKEYCTSEYDTKNIPEPTTRNGGQFTYEMTSQPVKSWYLAIRGYYIHPPGGGKR